MKEYILVGFHHADVANARAMDLYDHDTRAPRAERSSFQRYPAVNLTITHEWGVPFDADQLAWIEEHEMGNVMSAAAAHAAGWIF